MWSDEARAAAIAARQKGGGSGPDAIGADNRQRYGSMTDSDLKGFADSHQAAADGMAGKYSDSATGEHAKMASDARSMLADRHPSDRPAAAALSNGHPKSGLVGIHSASAISRGITKMRLAFHRTDG